ncbi:hypothetical protein [Marinithermus hydrothermalis]|nr:hypothetical protein [Marinithermus hydrothermalis]
MRGMRGWLVALLLVLGGAWAEPDYYPHALGLAWVYDSGEEQVFVEERELDGQRVWVLEHRFSGKARYADVVRYGEDGVWLLGIVLDGEFKPYDPPIQLYPPAPLWVGREWGSRSSLDGQRVVVVARVLRVEGVTVPAGRFNAFVIRGSLTTESGGSRVMDTYFVPGVGVVRFATQDGGAIDLIDLRR